MPMASMTGIVVQMFYFCKNFDDGPPTVNVFWNSLKLSAKIKLFKEEMVLRFAASH